MEVLTREQAKQEVRQRFREYLEPAKKAGTYICRIDNCNNGTGTTGDGMTVDPGGDGCRFHCFKCGFHGDLIDYYQAENHCSESEAFTALYKHFNINVDDYTRAGAEVSKTAPQPPQSGNKPENEAEPKETDFSEYLKQCQERLKGSEAEQYIILRGIRPSTAARYGLGYDPTWKNPAVQANIPSSPRLIIPNSRYGYLARDIREDAPKEYAKQRAGTVHLFNEKCLYSPEKSPIFVVEGEMDALSIIETEYENALALCSTSNAKKLLKIVSEKAIDKPFIICMDNDGPGEKAKNVLISGLENLGVAAIIANISGEYKDANEALISARSEFGEAVKAAIQEAEEKQKEVEKARYRNTAAGMVDCFLEDIQTERYKPLPTGLPAIDKALGGGFTRQTLVLLGAAPGLGKTTFATQIFENMAKGGTDILYINLEMSREQLLARSLSRLIRQDAGKVIAQGKILRGYEWNQEEKDLIQLAAAAYKNAIAPHLMYNPGMTDAKLDTILETMEKAAKEKESQDKPAPICILDYLQIIQPADGEDEVQAIKRAVILLKDFAIQHNTVVFVIMANNRASNASGKANLESGRDTSALEYSGDMLLGMEYAACREPIGNSEKPLTIEQINTLKDQAREAGDALPPEVTTIFLRVNKNRMGEDQRKARLRFDGQSSLFIPLESHYTAESAPGKYRVCDSF